VYPATFWVSGETFWISLDKLQKKASNFNDLGSEDVSANSYTEGVLIFNDASYFSRSFEIIIANKGSCSEDVSAYN
jgi:hypothetical protein